MLMDKEDNWDKEKDKQLKTFIKCNFKHSCIECLRLLHCKNLVPKSARGK
jgi:hypothetical protein